MSKSITRKEMIDFMMKIHEGTIKRGFCKKTMQEMQEILDGMSNQQIVDEYLTYMC